MRTSALGDRRRILAVLAVAATTTTTTTSRERYGGGASGGRAARAGYIRTQAGPWPRPRAIGYASSGGTGAHFLRPPVLKSGPNHNAIAPRHPRVAACRAQSSGAARRSLARSALGCPISVFTISFRARWRQIPPPGQIQPLLLVSGRNLATPSDVIVLVSATLFVLVVASTCCSLAPRRGSRCWTLSTFVLGGFTKKWKTASAVVLRRFVCHAPV